MDELFSLNDVAGKHTNARYRKMLVLSRKPGERILIGDHITITVVKLTNGGVRLGIEAPHELPIVREELKIAMDEQILRESSKQDGR